MSTDSLPFELQPTLTGKLLLLRPLVATDFEALYSAASDPLVWEQHPQSNRYRRDVFERFFEGAMSSGGALVAIDRATGTVAGSSRYYDVDTENRLVVIGYSFLSRNYWGGSYNREMKDLMLDHAFRFVDTVQFQIGTNNLRSRCAIEKIGAKFVTTRILDDVSHAIYQIKAERG